MVGTITLGQSSGTPLAVVRRQAKHQDVPRVIPDACGEVWRFVQVNAISGAGRHVAVYLDDVMNIEIGVEVPSTFVGDGTVVRSSMPAGAVASTVHIGPYQLLPSVHQAVRDWCAANGYALAGPCWEVYGHGTDDISKIQTDVHYLLK